MVLVLVGLSQNSQAQRTSAERISGGLFFGQRIVQVGPVQSSEQESQLVFELLANVAASNYRTGFAELEQYLAARTNSPWAPSLDAVLGKHYYDHGRYTLALEHWELAWLATKEYRNGSGKAVADYVLAHWTRLLASLGRYETLVVLVEENRTRILDRGPLSQMWARTREAVAEMRQKPGISYKCGTLALNSVARELGLQYDKRALLSVPSPASGFSMKVLADLSAQLRLGLIPVVRAAGEELAVPSVVHWRQDHYAAIVSRHGDLYRVLDPTFGRPRYLTSETINVEASGNFLVPADRVPANYRLLEPAEMEVIRGRGNPNFLGDADDQPYDCDGGEAPPGNNEASCGNCPENPGWRVSEPYGNIWLHKEPLGYQPTLGSFLSFKLNYKQRDELYDSLPPWVYPSVGLDWRCPWISAVDARWYATYQMMTDFTVLYGNGGAGFYEDAFDTGTYHNNLKLRAVTNSSGITSFELLRPDGGKNVYGFAPTNSYGNVTRFFLLTQQISPQGDVITLQYEGYDPDYPNFRLKYVIDADGRTNTIHYATSGYSTNLITQVDDPYGRSTYLQYDTNGLLTTITDVAGISRSIAYNELGWVTNLTTPDGFTVFQSWDKSFVEQYAIDRSVTITEPNNSKQLYVFALGWPAEPTSFPSSEVPTNTPIGTLDNDFEARNSFHWGRLQYPLLSTNVAEYLTTNDFLIGRMRHWLGQTDHGDGESVDTLSWERDFSPDGVTQGQKTWYDYPNKGGYGPGDKGDHILPVVTARVLPDGSAWYRYTPRNEWGWATQIVETYTKTDGTIGLRTNTMTYAANGVDLVQEIGPAGSQVVSNYFNNSYHQPDATYDALNQETKYTYNGYRQLTQVQRPSGLTTVNVYYSSGTDANRLQNAVDLEISRTNSYTYYANGLVYSHTDERGLTVTNLWDNLLRLTETKYPDGTTVSNRYANLDLVGTKDRLGHWSYFGYDSMRQKVAETNANGIITRYGYCDCGSLDSITNAWNTSVQMVTTFGYDNQGNRIYTYLPDATLTNWYDSLRRPIVTGDAWGYRWFFYNNQGLQTVVSNAYGAEQTTIFDAEDQPLYVTDANGVSVTNTYDALHRLSTRTYPDGGVERFGYSARGLIAYTNQLNKETYYVYDEAMRKTWETNANNEVLRYTNNAAGDLLSLTDGKDQTTRWSYDEYGRVTNKLDQVGAEILRYKYDPNSRLTNRWSTAKGNTYYAYDPVGNLTNINYPASTDVKFQYDPLNRVTNMVDAAGTTKYAYATGGQLWTEDGPFSSDTVTNSYNNRLRTALSLAQPTGKWTNSFGYDAAKRLTNVTSQAGSFAYLLPSTRPSTLVTRLTLPNTSYITNTYDSLARLTGTWLKNSSHSTLNSHQYTYNPGNQRTQQVFNVGSTYNYIYPMRYGAGRRTLGAIRREAKLWLASPTDLSHGASAIGQLTVGDSATASEDRRYVYDAAWNLNYRTNNTTLYTFKVDTKNQLTNATPVGNQTYDGNGNVTAWQSGSYSYDDENRLTSAQVYSSWKTDFVYDGLGRLRSRAEYGWTGSSWYPNGTTYYIYDGMRVIQERVGSPTVSYTRGTDLSGTLEGAGGIRGLLARSHGYASSNGNWYVHNCYHADGNGNITYLVNSSQTLAASYRYDPYGNTISSSGTLGSANVYRFSSKELHVNSGLYYYGYRWYSPSLQRWPTRDPIGEWGGLNLYGFVLNNPANYIDKHGLYNPITGPDGKPVGPGSGLPDPTVFLPPNLQPPPSAPKPKSKCPCPFSLSKLGFPGEAGAGLSAGAGMLLPLAGIGPSIGFEGSVAAMVTTECRFCISAQVTFLLGVGVMGSASIGPGVSYSPNGLEGPGAGVGFGASIGGVEGAPVGVTGAVDVDLLNGGVAGAVTRFGPTIAIAAYGRGFVSCTGCADPLNGSWMDRLLPQQVAQQRLLQCIASNVAKLLREASR
jgi:RHS repeat-associated protein